MNKIPEGTQYIESGCGEKGFRKYEKGCWWFFEGYWRHVDWKMGDLIPVSEHPFYVAQPGAWNGEGLPPEGTDLEAGFACEDFKKWHKGVCIAVGECPEGREEFCVVRFGKKIAMYTMDHGRMRPIRTAEQIAEDERLAGIAEIQRIVEAGFASGSSSSASLWDAGYRKQVSQ